VSKPNPAGTEAGDSRWSQLWLAVLAFLPLVLTQPGQVGADTKTYLYLDPARLLSRAPSLWDPNVGLGTVTHQTLGYLWPMGPYYWTMERLGVPDWLAQRLWLGAVMFAAGAGVLYLLRSLRWQGPGITVAAMAYMLSPYLLQYSARISVILLPWAALGWLVGLTVRAVRTGGWRHPALMGLVIMTIGGVNVTSLVMIAIAPVLWIFYATFVERETTPRAALAVALRIGVVTIGCCLWWIVGLALQGSYGIPIVRYTETYRTVAEASTATEALRGFGYWFFYGNDSFGPWIEPSAEYTNRTLLVGLSFGLPILALASGAAVRWRHRGFFLLLITLGGLIAVGSHPWDTTSPLGAVFKTLTGSSDAFLAMRSTPRAVPLVVLGTAVLLGTGVNALTQRIPRVSVALPALVGLLVMANLPAHFTLAMVEDGLKRDEALPDYWLDAAEELDSGDRGTRAWEIPGTDFASYRWGNTVDPITPGLTERPYVARELIPYGTASAASLLNAVDHRMQEGTFEPASLAPIARLMGVGDIVVRSDLSYERYRTPRPRPFWADILSANGLREPTTFGPALPNVASSSRPLYDPLEQRIDLRLDDPPEVAVIGVENPEPIIRPLSTARAQLYSGDAEGLVDAAAAGLLDPERAIFLNGHLAAEPELTELLLDQAAELIITDTNRRRGRRWGSIRENTGYTERAGERQLLDDPGDQRLEIFPDAGPATETVAVHAGGARVSATSYGNPVTFIPEDRAVQALDGALETSWRVGAFSDVQDEKLVVEFDEPVTTGVVTLVQPLDQPNDRWITAVRLAFDGAQPTSVDLDYRSRTAAGQLVEFDTTTFRRLEIIIEATNLDHLSDLDGVSAVGFAEVRVGDVVVEELIRMPSDLTDLGERAADHDLHFVMSRLRADPAERRDEERTLARLFTVPNDRTFSLTGSARLSTTVTDDLLASFVADDEDALTVRASTRLPGDLRSAARFAFDNDPSTRWNSPYGSLTDQWLEFETEEPTTLRRLDLQLLADPLHSLPTAVRVEATHNDVTTSATVAVPAGATDPADAPIGTVVDTPVEFAEMTGTRWRISFPRIAVEYSPDWFSRGSVSLPIAVAEVGAEGISVAPMGTEFVTECRDDLLLVDEDPISVMVTGTVSDAMAGKHLQLATCGANTAGIDLEAGDHAVRTSRSAGLDIDRLVLSSASTSTPASNPATTATTPELAVASEGRTSAALNISGADGPFLVVLGQSHSPGWQAEVEGASVTGPFVVNGFANGWLVTPTDEVTDLTMDLTWTPQRTLWFALVASLFAVAVALVLVARGRRYDPADPRPSQLAHRGAPSVPTLGLERLELSTRSRVVIGLGMVFFAVLNTPPGLATLLCVAAVVGALTLRPAALAPVGALAYLVAASGAFILQYLRGFAPGFGWSQNFPVSHTLSLVALIAVGAAAVAEWTARRVATGTGAGADLTTGEPTARANTNPGQQH
jgi:arabinofuranan 3-O-arabinosyltransferase